MIKYTNSRSNQITLALLILFSITVFISHDFNLDQLLINHRSKRGREVRSVSSYTSLFVDAVGQCETLGPDSCLTAYPDCMIVPLRGCCFGIGSICVSATFNYARDPESKGNVTRCLRNLVTNQVYQLDYDFQNITGYAIYDPILETCETAKCEQKNLGCRMISSQCQNPALDCCRAQPVCFEKDINIFKNIEAARGECDNNCPNGFICKIVNDLNTCLPTTCDYLTCDQYSECIELEELNIASCYLKLSALNIQPGCKNTPCPPGFQCSRGIFTDYDCVPIHNDVFHGPNGCDLCAPGFTCDEFGWGTLCTEWSFNNPADGEDCFGSKCLFKQHCNSTARRCEFKRCRDDASVCKGGMQCVQFDVTHPRVCASSAIIPVSEYANWATQFPFISSAPGFDNPPERLVRPIRDLTNAQSKRAVLEEHGFMNKIEGVIDESSVMARMKKLQDQFNHHIGANGDSVPIFDFVRYGDEQSIKNINKLDDNNIYMDETNNNKNDNQNGESTKFDHSQIKTPEQFKKLIYEHIEKKMGQYQQQQQHMTEEEEDTNINSL